MVLSHVYSNINIQDDMETGQEDREGPPALWTDAWSLRQ